MNVAAKKTLIGLTREGLKRELARIGLETKHTSMRASQLSNALYVQGATSFDRVTTLAEPLRNDLSKQFSLDRPEVVAAQTSSDGTRKWLIRFGPGIEIETVFIPEEDRGTLCVSSQVGCTLNCRFCHTGTQKLVRNLTSAEIVSQILVARDHLMEWPGARRITFEYVMLKGVNDTAADAKQLVRLMSGIPAKINLIPFNPWPGAPYECSDWEQIETFGEIVNRAGYASPIRTPRGRDIMAACGQLKSASVKQRASERLAAMPSHELARMPS